MNEKKPKYRMLEVMVAWTPKAVYVSRFAATRGLLKVGKWPDRTRWSQDFELTGGACDSAWHTFSKKDLLRAILDLFNTLTLIDGISLEYADAAFMEIAEYAAYKDSLR